MHACAATHPRMCQHSIPLALRSREDPSPQRPARQTVRLPGIRRSRPTRSRGAAVPPGAQRPRGRLRNALLDSTMRLNVAVALTVLGLVAHRSVFAMAAAVPSFSVQENFPLATATTSNNASIILVEDVSVDSVPFVLVQAAFGPGSPADFAFCSASLLSHPAIFSLPAAETCLFS